MNNYEKSGIKELNILELPSAKFVELENDIVIIYYKEIDEEFGIKDAKEHTTAIYELRKGKPCHLIINFLGVRVQFSNSAREYFATNKKHSYIRLSQAIVIEGLAQKIVANFYKTFNKPNCPIEIFSNEVDAIRWSIAIGK